MEEKKYYCRKNCGSEFPHSGNRCRHEKTCTVNDESSEVSETNIEASEVSKAAKVSSRAMICSNSWCNRSFSKPSNMNRHLKACKKTSEIEKQCFLCKKTFSRKTHLRRHMEVHTKSKLFCVKCKKTYKRKDKLEKHVLKCGVSATGGFFSVKQRSEVFPTIVIEDYMDADGEDTFHMESVDESYPVTMVDIDLFIENNISGDNGEDENENEHNEHDDNNRSEIDTVYNVDNGFDEVVKTAADQTEDNDDDDNDTFVHDISECTKKYIKSQIRLGRNSIKKRVETARFIVDLFGEKLKNNGFFEWLGKELGIGNSETFNTYLQWAEKDRFTAYRFKRNYLSPQSRQEIYDFWKKHSTLSVDRRNNRQSIKISKKKLSSLANGVVDDNIKVVIVRGVDKLEAHKYIYTSPVRKLHKSFIAQYGEVSRGTFHKLKPFYLQAPTEREKESCLCMTCLNAHCIYEPLKRHFKFPDSLTEYLIQDFKCETDTEIDFPCIKCINGSCLSKCKIQNESEMLQFDEKLHSYYVFEKVPTIYYNKNAEEVTYYRTARVDKKDTLKNIYKLLQDISKKYIEHRYYVTSDKYFWDDLRTNYDEPILTLDYSQNICLKPKYEAQSAHFSGRQQTLHCSYIQHKGDISYIYHLSDDTNKDSVLSMAIIEDIIQNYPIIIEGGRLVLRSDNCSTQYKSRYIFHKMIELAKKYQIMIDWYYGIAGHGRGTVDGMSSFGCKSILRDAIIKEDKWFENAKEMVCFLQDEKADDPSKTYHLVDHKMTAIERIKERPEYIIKGCMSYHKISVDENGTFNLKKILHLADKNSEDGDAIEEDGYAISEMMALTMYEVIQPGTYVGLRSPASSIELFFIVKVIEKGVAADAMIDKAGHMIAAGENYLLVIYLDLKSHHSSFIKFEIGRKCEPVLIHVNEVFAVNVELCDNHKMKMDEYRSLCMELY